MGHLLSALLVALAANLDNAGVGVAYGLRRVRIPPLPNLNIALIAAVGTIAASGLGFGAERLVGAGLANAIGAVILIAIGLWIMLPAVAPGNLLAGLLRQPERADSDSSGEISLRESWLLGLALGVNAWAGGFGSALIGLSPWVVAAATGAFSYIMLWLPASAAQRLLSGAAGRMAPLLAGLLLILIGMHDLI